MFITPLSRTHLVILHALKYSHITGHCYRHKHSTEYNYEKPYQSLDWWKNADKLHRNLLKKMCWKCDTRIQKCWGAHISGVNLGEQILYYIFVVLNMEVTSRHPSSLTSWCSRLNGTYKNCHNIRTHLRCKTHVCFQKVI